MVLVDKVQFSVGPEVVTYLCIMNSNFRDDNR